MHHFVGECVFDAAAVPEVVGAEEDAVFWGETAVLVGCAAAAEYVMFV